MPSFDLKCYPFTNQKHIWAYRGQYNHTSRADDTEMRADASIDFYFFSFMRRHLQVLTMANKLENFSTGRDANSKLENNRQSLKAN